MKKFILSIVIIAFFIYPSVCLSSYLIKLKNGSTFITNHYWKKKGQIKFYFRGGIVGIRKDLIRQIRESDLPYIVGTSQQARKEKVQTETEYKPEKKSFLKEKMRIATEIETVSTAFREAKKKKDRKQIQVERKRLLSLQTELSKLREKVKADHGGQAPAWWDSPQEAP